MGQDTNTSTEGERVGWTGHLTGYDFISERGVKNKKKKKSEKAKDNMKDNIMPCMSRADRDPSNQRSPDPNPNPKCPG